MHSLAVVSDAEIRSHPIRLRSIDRKRCYRADLAPSATSIDVAPFCEDKLQCDERRSYFLHQSQLPMSSKTWK